MKHIFLLLAMLGFVTGCSSLASWKDPAVKLQNRSHFYVETELADGRKLHAAIAEELRAMGCAATSGPLTMMPGETDVLVSFQSRWEWDFTTYLIELDLQMRDPKSGRILATVRFHRPALGGTSTQDVIQRVLVELLGAKKTAAVGRGFLVMG